MPLKYLKDYVHDYDLTSSSYFYSTSYWTETQTKEEKGPEDMPVKRGKKKKTRRPTRRPRNFRPLSEVENLVRRLEGLDESIKIPEALKRGEHLGYLKRLWRRPGDGKPVNPGKLPTLLELGQPSKICKIEDLFGLSPEIPVKVEFDALLTDDRDLVKGTSKHKAYLLRVSPGHRGPRSQFIIDNYQTLVYPESSTVYLFNHKITQLPADIRKWGEYIRGAWLKQRMSSPHGRPNGRGFRLVDVSAGQLVKLRKVNPNPSRKQLRRERSASEAEAKHKNELSLEILD